MNEKEFENCGHANIIFNDGRLYHCSFDFHRNRAIVKNHLDSAKQFYETVKYASDNNYLSPFIDNSFSSMELLAKSELLLQPISGLENKAEYNKRGRNTSDKFEKSKIKILNQLSELRIKARV